MMLKKSEVIPDNLIIAIIIHLVLLLRLSPALVSVGGFLFGKSNERWQ